MERLKIKDLPGSVSELPMRKSGHDGAEPSMPVAGSSDKECRKESGQDAALKDIARVTN